MIKFTAPIKKFAKQGEKTGWTYIPISAEIASQLKPGCKKSFRVKGKLDDHRIDCMALLPMGSGAFILTLNADIRKAIKKGAGDTVQVQIEEDEKELKSPDDLMLCLGDEPDALTYFKSLTQGHQAYFGKWIDSAKTEETRAKRIAHTVNAMLHHKDYGAMIRSLQAEKESFK